jgi:hypothetical protein
MKSFQKDESVISENKQFTPVASRLYADAQKRLMAKLESENEVRNKDEL